MNEIRFNRIIISIFILFSSNLLTGLQECDIIKNTGMIVCRSGCGAVGSVLPWGGRGRPFKSGHSDQKSNAVSGIFRRCVVFVFDKKSLAKNVPKNEVINRIAPPKTAGVEKKSSPEGFAISRFRKKRRARFSSSDTPFYYESCFTMVIWGQNSSM